jgi:hypothetical protein
VRFQLSIFEVATLADVGVVTVPLAVASVADDATGATAVPRAAFDSASMRRGERESDAGREGDVTG